MISKEEQRLAIQTEVVAWFTLERLQKRIFHDLSWEQSKQKAGNCLLKLQHQRHLLEDHIGIH